MHSWLVRRSNLGLAAMLSYLICKPKRIANYLTGNNRQYGIATYR